MRVLVCSRSDAASVNIRDRLVERGDWRPLAAASGGAPAAPTTFRGASVLARGPDRLVEIEGPSVRDEALSDDLAAFAAGVGGTGLGGLPGHGAIAAVWFLSRHRAESGHPSLTVHPVGNHGPNDLGGKPRHLPPAAARDMGALLRRLRAERDAHALPHSVTYEATHHGPDMAWPTLFVELGSDEAWYNDPASGRALAAAVSDVLDGRGAAVPGAPVLVGVGGGHYVPRHTDLASEGLCDFGHFVPAYAVAREDADADLLRRAVAATPGCTGVYVHKKGLKGPERQRVKAWIEELGVAEWSRDD